MKILGMTTIIKTGSDEYDATDEHVLVLESGRAERHYWRDIWHYRELFAILAWRDVSVRYKQTAMGVAWAVLRPLFTMAVFTVCLRPAWEAAVSTASRIPFWCLPACFPGILGLQLTERVLPGDRTESCRQVYFPRMIIPVPQLSGVLDLLVNSSDVLGADRQPVSADLPGLAGNLRSRFSRCYRAQRLAWGYWLSALNVSIRDFRYMIPFLAQFGVFISPVGLHGRLAASVRRLYGLNPIAGVDRGIPVGASGCRRPGLGDVGLRGWSLDLLAGGHCSTSVGRNELRGHHMMQWGRRSFESKGSARNTGLATQGARTYLALRDVMARPAGCLAPDHRDDSRPRWRRRQSRRLLGPCGLSFEVKRAARSSASSAAMAPARSRC